MPKFLLKVLFFTGCMFVIDVALSSLLSKGLRTFMDIETDADVVFVGHSHTQSAIDAPMIEKLYNGQLKVTKLAMHGMNLSDRSALLKYYYNCSKVKPKVVVFDIDDAILSKPKGNLNTHTRFYPFMDDPDIYAYIVDNEKDKSAVIARRIVKTLRFNNSWILVRAVKGLFGLTDQKAINSTMANPAGKRLKTNPITLDPESEELFAQNFDFLEKQGTSVVLAYYPKYFANDMDERNHQMVRQRVAAIVGSRAKRFLDYNRDFGSKPDLFYDLNHLNRKGQEILSRQMAKDLRPVALP